MTSSATSKDRRPTLDDRPAVLHVVHPWGQPSERFVRDLLTHARTTRPVVATGEVPGEAPEGIVVREVAPWSRHLRPRGAEAVCTCAVAALATRLRAGLVHSHFLRWAPVARHGARLARRPWVLSLHGHDLLVEARDPAVSELIRRADRVTVPSPFLRDHAIRTGIDPDRIRVIPSGIATADHRFRVRRLDDGEIPLVAVIGRFVEKKGMLDAVDALAACGVPVRGRFVGYGPMERRIRERIASRGVVADVVDGRDPSAVGDALDEAHVVLTPSRTARNGDAETLCIVNLEAQACGIPVLSTSHGGIPFGTTPESAVLVPEGDLPALADALGELIRHPERWEAMGRAGRAHVERRFELGDRARDVETLYGEVL